MHMPLKSVYSVDKLTQTINVGRVTLSGGIPTEVVPANPNRYELRIVWVSGAVGSQYFSISPAVDSTNGFPYTQGSEGVMVLDWRSAVYGYQGGFGNSSTFAYIEEVWT
jgi:hypothetical protein